MSAIIPWQPVVAPPPLTADAIHIWRLPTSLPPEADRWLDAAERARLGGMLREDSRRNWLCARVGLKRVLAGYLGTRPELIRFTVMAGGKPRLSNGPSFNLSHTGPLSLVAVSHQPVGIDVERRRTIPRALAIAQRVLGADDIAHLQALTGTARDDAFLHAWTGMEASQKCLGEGVFGRRIDTSRIGKQWFSPDPTHIAALAWEKPEATPVTQWLTFRS